MMVVVRGVRGLARLPLDPPPGNCKKPFGSIIVFGLTIIASVFWSFAYAVVADLTLSCMSAFFPCLASYAMREAPKATAFLASISAATSAFYM
jgi:hypothetical protein